jgi:predicted ATPase
MIQKLTIEGYRSIRDLSIDLLPINVLTGANGCGKSNLYNSLVLIARAAEGRLARAIAEEGGTPSVFWAGGERIRYQRKKPPKRVIIGFEGKEYGYEIQVGLPAPNELPLGTLFLMDPRVKEEYVWPSGTKRTPLMLKRDQPSAWLRDSMGKMVTYPFSIAKSESVLSQIIDPHLYPEISAVRTQILGWRFYHHFRTDRDSPLRQPQIGVQTPVLSQDGSDLAAALRTIQEIGDDGILQESIETALGASLEVTAETMQFRMSLKVPGLLRELQAREFSDGQLRFLCLCAALLSPRPPSVLALNEPETSLHPDLIDPLARLIVVASKYTQMWITTHSKALAERIEKHSGVPRIQLEMRDGETTLGAIEQP